MDINKKWVVRAGTLLILLGFILPTMAVSCTGYSYAGNSLSLYDLASQANQAVLYLVPLAILAVLVLSFLPANSANQASAFFWCQVGGTVVSGLCILVSLLSIYNQLKGYMGNFLTISPEIGIFVLFAGFLMCGIGLSLSRPELAPVSWAGPILYAPPQPPPPQPAYPPPVHESRPVNHPQAYSPAAAPAGPVCRLELVKGQSPEPVITIQSDFFTIGRGSANDLQLTDPQVSRTHARLRYAGGAWYIQDQGSTTGIQVNGEPQTAIKLNSGDQISLGNTTFRFIC